MQGPLERLEQWDDFVKARYAPDRDKTEVPTVQRPDAARRAGILSPQSHLPDARFRVAKEASIPWPEAAAAWVSGKPWNT